MLSSSSPADTREEITPAGKSFLSRLKSPFSSKTRNVADYYVQPDDPHKQYVPGDVITGSVILKVLKPLRVTHIVVCLHGYVQVYKNPNSPGETYRPHSSSGAGGKRGGTYSGNGFATLFDDEVILCGEGRLAEGLYQFQFELEFPRERLPNSIDFERGTVTYMITSTLTRPTAIAPTISCDTKVQFSQNTDIAPFAPPKPRVITLEPVNRRSRTKEKVKRRKGASIASDSQTIKAESTGAESSHTEQHADHASEAGGTQTSDVPNSPAHSDASFDTCLSSSATGSGVEYGPASVRTSGSNITKSAPPGRTITANIELQKAGFLPGDNIPIKISVNHTKHIKSLRGIIVTFYRSARVDMHPVLPPVPTNEAGKRKNEDYYPKSRTGLGGLSLSSAGSHHVFRKDLSQSYASLIVDPTTLTAEVKVSVRVPEDVFPTIATVPGEMISFKYYVEVVLDLQGKLSGLDRLLSNAGMMSVPANYGNTPDMPRVGDTSGSVYAAWGGHFIDTEQIRRDKSVVSCVFEVIIGSRDSDRKKGKQKAEASSDAPVSDPMPQNGHQEQLPDTSVQHAYTTAGAQEAFYDYQAYGHSDTVDHYDHYYGHYQYDSDYGQPNYDAPPVFPLSGFEDESGLSEKERLNRAEARLLPSRPPDIDAGTSSHAPSAPPLDDAQGIVHRDPRRREAASPVERADSAGPSAPSAKDLPALPVDTHQRGNAPEYDAEAGASSHAQATDDKQELQRQRLHMERSAPEDFPEEEDENASGSRAGEEFAPSAPPLDDEDFGLNLGHRIPALPKYER